MDPRYFGTVNPAPQIPQMPMAQARLPNAAAFIRNPPL
jgi:hypothetical protein